VEEEYGNLKSAKVVLKQIDDEITNLADDKGRKIEVIEEQQ
jgi:hypothetical protein